MGCVGIGSRRGIGRGFWEEDNSLNLCVFVNNPGGRKRGEGHSVSV